MSEMVERCDNCDDPTGRCGIGDDSLYLGGGRGPFCPECYRVERITEFEAKADRLDEVVGYCEGKIKLLSNQSEPWPSGFVAACRYVLKEAKGE